MSVQEKQLERLAMVNEIEGHTTDRGNLLDLVLTKADRQLIVEALRATATPVAWRWRLAEQHPWHYAELNPPQLPAGSECQPLYAADQARKQLSEVLVVQRDDSKPFGLVGHLIPVDREMEKLLKEARAKVAAMSATELDEMLHKQGVGWARSEAQWAKDFRDGKTDRD